MQWRVARSRTQDLPLNLVRLQILVLTHRFYKGLYGKLIFAQNRIKDSLDRRHGNVSCGGGSRVSCISWDTHSSSRSGPRKKMFHRIYCGTPHGSRF